MKIFIVDDELDRIQSYIAELELPENNYEVITINNVDDALDFFSQNNKLVDFVILDIMMNAGKLINESGANQGLRTGLILYQKIRYNYPDLPIILLTNVSSLNNKQFEEQIQRDSSCVLLQKIDTLPWQLIEEVKQMSESP